MRTLFPIGVSAATVLFLVTSGSFWSNAFAQVYAHQFNTTLAASGWTNTNLTAPWSSGNFFGLSNNWYVDDSESGRPANTCGAANMGNFSLYMGCVGLGPLGAAYVANARTNRRISSPNINTTGFSNMRLEFDFIANGAGTSDKAYLQYSVDGGATWISPAGPPTSALPALPAGSNLNNLKSQICGSGQGLWTHVTWTLPVACENIPNLRIGFVWQNNNSTPGATDPCLAINDLTITVTPLPVTLSYISAVCVDGSNTIEWQTESELNNKCFTLFSSSDLIKWELIGLVTGAGNSLQPIHYSFSDTRGMDKIVYYKLRQTDFDGRFEETDPIACYPCKKTTVPGMQVWPNPVVAGNLLNVHPGFELPGEWSLIKPDGTIVYRKKCETGREQTIPIPGELGSGIYLLSYRQEDGFENVVRVMISDP